jgi:glycosyltransferase involved in cell wall biosynthesis
MPTNQPTIDKRMFFRASSSREMATELQGESQDQTTRRTEELAKPDPQFRLTIVTDAWSPQVNGVVRTYEWLARSLPALGVRLHFLTPEPYATIGLPTYREIRLSLVTPSHIARQIEKSAPDAVHIATEGPLGVLARSYCLAAGIGFTTCYHTRYPEYIAARVPVPLAWSYALLRRFHNLSRATMVATPELLNELTGRGFSGLRLWRRGIDIELFSNAIGSDLPYPRPLFMFAGRIAVEKNIGSFLELKLPGTKIVVGDGPSRIALQRRYPEVKFLGTLESAALASIYRAADVFVFPSRTDTYGLVMAEALAAGTPVAAYPTAGARAIFGQYRCGVLDTDLKRAALAALDIPREIARLAGARHSIHESAASFLKIIKAAV